MAVTTYNERAELRAVRDGISNLIPTVPGRYFLSESQRASYNMVLRHLDYWCAYEGVDR